MPATYCRPTSAAPGKKRQRSFRDVPIIFPRPESVHFSRDKRRLMPPAKCFQTLLGGLVFPRAVAEKSRTETSSGGYGTET